MENLIETGLKEECGENAEDYLKKWRNYYPEQSSKILKTIKLFHKEKTKEDYIKALCLWTFVKEHFKDNDMSVRRKFLKNFINQEIHTLLSFVAMIESLPTSVFRKVLWKYNLDFMTDESFLRRVEFEPEEGAIRKFLQKYKIDLLIPRYFLNEIEDSQEEAVRRNYQQLFEKNKVPEVFGWFEITFKKISVEKLLKEKTDFRNRYERKGAMSYNLLNLDFGQNAYPRGYDDDYKQIEINPFYFFSEKNHADDFIVNQEFGKYSWLYKKRLSNYVWGRYKDVQLKKHICLGFLFTFIAHLIFWVISPLLFFSLGDIFGSIKQLDLHSFEKVLLATPVFLLAIITPFWLAIALLKFAWETLQEICRNSSLIKKIGTTLDKLGEKLNKNDEIFNTILAIIVIFWLLFCAFLLNFYLFRGLYPAFGIWVNLIIIFWINFYFVEQIFLNDRPKKIKSFKHCSRFFRLITIPIVAYLLFRFFAYYKEWLYSIPQLITGTVLSLVEKTWFVISNLGALNIYWLLPITVFIAFRFFKYSRKAYSICSKIIYGYCFAIYLHLLFIIAYPMITSDVSLMTTLSLQTTLFLIPFLILTIIYLLYFNYQNPKLEEITNIVFLAKCQNDLFMFDIGRRESKLLLKNDWLQKQDKKFQTEIVSKMVSTTAEIFGEEKVSLGYKLMAKKFTDISLSKISRRIDWINRQELELKIELLRLVIDGKNCNKDTLRKARKILIKKRENRKAIKMLFKIIFSPIYLIFKVLYKVFYEYPITFYKMINFIFNKICPHVAESGPIKSTKF